MLSVYLPTYTQLITWHMSEFLSPPLERKISPTLASLFLLFIYLFIFSFYFYSVNFIVH